MALGVYSFSLLGNHEHAHVGGPVVPKFYPDEARVLDEALANDRERIHDFFRSFPLIAVTSCGVVLPSRSHPGDGDRSELAAGGGLTQVPHRPGTRQYLSCERGRITVWAAGERYDLSPGERGGLPGDQAHSYHNEGDTPAIGFSVVTLAPVPGALLTDG